MEIKRIFAPSLFAIRFEENEFDEYKLAIKQWSDVEHLKTFYETNKDFIKENPYFPEDDTIGFINFVTENSRVFDDEMLEAAENSDLSRYFEYLTRTKNYREILPYKKSKKFVLRLYGIQLEEIIIITGSAIKLTDEMDKHPETAEQLNKLAKVQDHLLSNSIFDEDSFFGYLEENNYD